MVDQEKDLQDAIAEEKAAREELAANQAAAFKRLDDKIAALGTGTDLTQEIADVKAEAAEIRKLSDSANAEGTTPPVTPA